MVSFVAKAQNPLVADNCSSEFILSSLKDFVDEEWELLHNQRCEAYSLSRNKLCRLTCGHNCIITGLVKKIDRNTISFWLRAIIRAYRFTSEGDGSVARAKVHEVQSIITIIYFFFFFAPSQLLQAGTL